MHAVSVVIPVLNGAAYVAEAIDSVRAQGASVAEIIVVDDGSTDDTVAIVGAIADPRLRLITGRKGRKGVSAARNDGAALATSDGLMFLDADDRLRPGAFDALLTDFPESAVAVYGDYERIDANGQVAGKRYLLRRRAKPSGQIAERLLSGNFIVNGGVILVRRAAFAAIGGFEETLRYGEDWHAWCRLALRGDILYRPVHVLDYRVYAASVMMARPLAWSDCTPVLDALAADPDVTAAFSDDTRRMLQQRAAGHLNAYVLGQSIRAHRYGPALAGLIDTALKRPGQLLKAIKICGAALVGI